MKQTILLMDNDDRFLEVYAAALSDEGYEVIAVNSIAKAEEKLAPFTIHLAILDVRMEDDTDENDISGLKLAEEKAYQNIPKIILTAHPSWHYAEKALGAALEGIQIVGMASKANGPDALLELVKQAFEKHHFVNDQLVVRWSHSSLTSFPSLVVQLSQTVRTENLLVRSQEMEALFRRLFYDCDQITISHLFKQNSGMLFLGVVSYSAEKKERDYVVVCGYKEYVVVERERFAAFFPYDNGPNRLIQEREIDTSKFSGTSYTLAGMDLSSVIQFDKFYAGYLIEDVIHALDQLFEKKLYDFYHQGWFQEQQRKVNNEIVGELGLKERSQNDWDVHIQALCQEILRASLTKISLDNNELWWQDDAFPNPIALLFQMPSPLMNLSTLCGATLGQLNGETILLNSKLDVQLLDYSRIGDRPLVADFVALETVVKYDFLKLLNVDVIFEMEQRMLNISELDEGIVCHEFDLEAQKAIQAIGHIRQHAVSIVGNEIEPYFIVLYYYAMAQLTAFMPNVHYSKYELLPFLHALLTATFICKKLSPQIVTNLSPEHAQGLWIDVQNKDVYVDSKKIILTGREFSLLHFLYQHKGQLCDRIDIAEAVFEWQFDKALTKFQKRKEVEDFINSTMSRLRKKIEINPKHQYILTERGIGYRLELREKYEDE